MLSWKLAASIDRFWLGLRTSLCRRLKVCLTTISVVFDVFRRDCEHWLRVKDLHRDERVRRETRERVKWLLAFLARYFAIRPRR
jgi:hypothetical protein